MPKGDKTKRIRGIDLSVRHFLFARDPQRPAIWLLPVCDPRGLEQTRHLIQRGLEHWDTIADHIPVGQLERVRWQLEGAAQAHGIALPIDQTISEAEMSLLKEAHSFADRMMRLAELDGLYD